MPNNELTRTQEKLLDKSMNCYMIGRVEDEYAIITTQYGNVQFFVNPLCDDPKAILDMESFIDLDDEVYIGIDRFQPQSSLPDFYDAGSYDDEGKLQDMKDHLMNRLVIFKPDYNKSPTSNKWYKNLTIKQLVADNENRYNYFCVIPRISLEPKKFEQILKKGEYFDIPEFDGEVNEIPDLVICGQYAYRLKDYHSDYELITPNGHNFERWKCNNSDQVVKIELSKFESLKTDIIRVNDNISFIEDDLRNQILSTNDYIDLDTEEVIKPIILKEETMEIDKAESKSQEAKEINEFENRELNFIKGLHQLTINRGLRYEYSDLINFHTSIKTNSLTILAGMSGTGKTQLAYNYARMLNLSEDNDTLLFMPISPSYTEPSDVLGYLNSMNGLYVPSETGLVNFLHHASLNTEQMHMVIFDEMNLSQVEYWFSPFISVLEKDPDERYLQLYDQNAHCINENIYPKKIKIGENVIFVGTVNIDDTTKDFSDRLLDRTFVISLNKLKFEDFYREMTKNIDQITDITLYKCENVSEFMRWNKSNNRTYLTAFNEHNEELLLLDELDELIRKYIPEGGVSYRVLKNIGNYINNVPKNSNNEMIIERVNVIDVIINQTIMTKIRGSESQLTPLLGVYDFELEKVTSSKLIELLDKYSSISNFEKVRKTIEKKSEDLLINGYTN